MYALVYDETDDCDYLYEYNEDCLSEYDDEPGVLYLALDADTEAPLEADEDFDEDEFEAI